ncbi:hypothetical protein D4M71_03895 [Klebsiella quasipneumoniae]|nr:hypothetical protein D4M71_03895 [Klebsiella quasipneumoniae]TXV75653.1 hypothetical protein D4M73_06605 [Klebsiella quasipneumoniae]TXW66692.1 hypothetical protein D4M67_01395 [Klebsiella quasipneumoniae]TXW84109.1 hypothetical protein D4M66_03895 [Klebsiella quasipneumoniae]
MVFSLSLWERAGVRAWGGTFRLTLSLFPKGRGDRFSPHSIFSACLTAGAFSGFHHGGIAAK